MFEVLLLSIALAMDAFALAIVNGIKYSNYGKKQMLCASFAFGIFQAAMPLLGLLVITPFISYIEKIDHWVVFIILFLIGFSMVKEGLKKEEIEDKIEEYSFKLLIVQAIATSIDALSVGISLPSFNLNPYISCALIGGITTVICLIGHTLGKKLALLLKDKAVIFGGIVLIIIGLEALIEGLIA